MKRQTGEYKLDSINLDNRQQCQHTTSSTIANYSVGTAAKENLKQKFPSLIVALLFQSIFF